MQLFFNEDLDKRLGPVPQDDGLLIIDYYDQQVQCLESDRELNCSAGNTWYSTHHQRQLQLPHVQAANKLPAGNSIQRVGWLFWGKGMACLLFVCC